MNVITISYKGTNCYLIPTVDGWFMIDAGWPDTFSQLLHLLDQQGISVDEIDYLMITHYHPDHAGLTQNLKDLGINLILHEVQVPYVSKINQYFRRRPKNHFKDIVTGGAFILSDAESRSFMNSIGIDGELISTPGHREDSISLVLDHLCAFTGDLPPCSDRDANQASVVADSWDKLRAYGIKTIYPGHGEPYTLS